ncbi:ATP-dependent RNA helicase HrpA [Escherichia coli O103]|uniref:ATP-dependent RNA helicase HrpA n=2 Tax=Escherichia coli TaxID=562 RepID=A0A1V2GAT7_ECOLX|nr:ATP-dependent RNA helicase HrpA [Escherichia coli]EIH0338644.1 ATP-dependent RNA helicase HrpA [Escherichia coli O22]EKK9163145.1 ATP-dependent RNA helicase HrpA [Escherichia coli O103]EEU9147667.1 ATP-dependent RNA helicase HrpA [Escherichia coli]EEW2131337.1 ATP-dependent RNA helicase HrpA [Escherichia coli]EFH3105898.1 ATP-dependent RNA helicase HrpA [Escherichia coli]
MLSALQKDGCLYQQDVVDYLVKVGNEQHLKENADGNQALSTKVINKFRVDSGGDVVWVRPDKYWRYRVPEDEEGREARG